MKDGVFRTMGVIGVVVPLVAFLMFSQPTYTILSNSPVYYDVNYVLLTVLELMNIGVAVFLFKVGDAPRLWYVLISLYFASSMIVPVYHIEQAAIPTGPNAHLMGLAIVDEYHGIYGFDISGIVAKS